MNNDKPKSKKGGCFTSLIILPAIVLLSVFKGDANITGILIFSVSAIGILALLAKNVSINRQATQSSAKNQPGTQWPQAAPPRYPSAPPPAAQPLQAAPPRYTSAPQPARQQMPTAVHPQAAPPSRVALQQRSRYQAYRPVGGLSTFVNDEEFWRLRDDPLFWNQPPEKMPWEYPPENRL